VKKTLPHPLHAMQAFGDVPDLAGTVLRAGLGREDGSLVLRYVLAGPASRIRLPSPATPATRADRLWEHTCFEAFLSPPGGEAYWEVNLAPSGDWNMYRFDGYREGMRPEPRALAPAVELERASCGTLTVRARLDLAAIAELVAGPLDVGLAAVLEANDGTRSYWAVRHATTTPDFHRRESFVGRLDGEVAP
jgi:hypothetical protein